MEWLKSPSPPSRLRQLGEGSASKETVTDWFCKMWASSRAAAALGHVNQFWVFVLVLGYPLPMYLLGETQLELIGS